MRVNVLHDLLPKGPDAEIRGTGSIGNSRIGGTVSGQGTAFINPFLPSPIHNTTILMAIHLKYPEGITGPPVIAIAIENDRMVIANAFITNELPKSFLIDVVANHLML